MELKEALEKNKKRILAVWLERTLDSYVSSGFFKKSQDKFANPVGANIREGLTTLFDILLAEGDQSAMQKPLDQVIRIRAVQEFTPAQAVAPILELKWVVKQVFKVDRQARELLPELEEFDCDVDRAALAAFDIYTACREQLYRNRLREYKSGRYILTDATCASAMIRENREEIARLQ